MGDLADHNCRSHITTLAGERTQTFPQDVGSEQSFLVAKPLKVGQKELLQSVTIMMKEVMKESQQQMMQLFSQMIQQQPSTLPMAWRIPGQQQ